MARQCLGYIILSENAHAPQRATSGAAGYDLRSAQNYILRKNNKILVKTDICVKLPTGCYGRIAGRSGLALNNSILVGAGVIDNDYTGNLAVILFNLSDSDFYIKKGDKIAQLICEKIFTPEVTELKHVEATERGDRGFGSTD